MTPRLPLLSTALLTGMLLAASPAEARFGKSSSSSDSSQDDKKDSDSGKRTHDASPVGTSRPSPPPSRPSHEAVPAERPRYQPRHHESYEPAPTYYAPPPPVYYDSPRASVSASGDEYASRHKNFVFGFDMQALPEGAAAGIHLGLEGERWGGMLRASGLSLLADDGSGEQDSISLFETHLSYAVLTGPRGRLRLEGGLTVAKAPDVTFVGPMVGTSAEYYLLDSLALEGRVQVTPLPYRQLDTSGGLAWYIFGDLVALRGGVRMLVLDDAGVVDGVVHQDVLPGPYLSIGLAI